MNIDSNGYSWWHWAAAVAVVVTAGGALAAVGAVASVASGVAATTTATTKAAGVFIGTSTGLAASTIYAVGTSTSLEEFADKGGEALVAKIVGGVLGGVDAYSIAKTVDVSDYATETFVPDEYWKSNAPANSTPGAKFDHYINNNGVIERSTVIYDNYGRIQYRIDYNNHDIQIIVSHICMNTSMESVTKEDHQLGGIFGGKSEYNKECNK